MALKSYDFFFQKTELEPNKPPARVIAAYGTAYECVANVPEELVFPPFIASEHILL